MRKIKCLLFMMTVVLLCGVSCKKDKDIIERNKIDDYSDVFWKINDDVYKLDSAQKFQRGAIDSSILIPTSFYLVASGSDTLYGNHTMIIIYFKEFPTISSRIKLYSDTNSVDSNVCFISIITFYNLYTINSIGEKDDYVDVTVKDGKITVEFSNIKARIGEDEYILSGKIRE